MNLDEESTEKQQKECCDRLARMQGSSAESGVIRSYLDACLALPWHTATEDDLDQAHALEVLDREHYGLQKVKERILELLAVRRKRTCWALSGKTSSSTLTTNSKPSTSGTRTN